MSISSYCQLKPIDILSSFHPSRKRRKRIINDEQMKKDTAFGVQIAHWHFTWDERHLCHLNDNKQILFASLKSRVLLILLHSIVEKCRHQLVTECCEACSVCRRCCFHNSVVNGQSCDPKTWCLSFDLYTKF